MAVPVRDRSGFTLVELLVALVISGLLVGIVFQLMQGQARYVGIQSSREEVQQNARAAIEMIGSELRSVPPAVGLRAAFRDSVSIRVPRVWGVVCATAGAQLSVRIPTVEGVSYEPTDSTRFSANVATPANPWTEPVRVTSVSAASAADCGGSGNGSEVRRLTLSAAPRTLDNIDAAVGNEAYIYDPVTYRVGTSVSLGGLWIERRSGSSGSQPLAGPILSGSGEEQGLRFRYFAGSTELSAPVLASDLDDVSKIEVLVRTISRGAADVDRQIEQDTVLISLRNRS